MKVFIDKNKIKITLIGIIITISTIGANVSDTDKYSAKGKVPEIDSSFQYTVVKVIDGDTFDIKVNGNNVRVRMLGVDTPEIKDPRKTVQCFGKEASSKTKELLLKHSVKVETDKTQARVDKFNRLLAYVYRDDGIFVNKYLLENGYAHEYTYNIPYEKQKEFKDYEKTAREGRMGLWGDKCNTLKK